jgi:hypothetical protein
MDTATPATRGLRVAGPDRHDLVGGARARTARRALGASIPDLLAGSALIASLLVLYRQVVNLWWTYDDLFNVHYISEHRPWQYCLEPSVWRLFPGHMLTPLLFLSLHLDLGLFGASPRAMHAHELAAVGLAMVAFYAVLRLWLPVAPALVGAGLALLGTPTASLVQLIMTRHYPDGLLLAALAIIVFVLAESRLPRGPRRTVAFLVSALCYLLASLAKEIFVPLVVFFPMLAAGSAGRRLRLAALHFAAFFFYLAWRLYMLGTLGGGYGWSVTAADYPHLAASLPLKLVQASIGASPRAGMLLLAAIAIAAAVASFRRPRTAVLVLVAVAAAILPILPASTEMQARYAFPLWLVLAATMAFACARLAAGGRWGRVGAVVLAAVATLSALGVNRRAWADSFAEVERVSIENHTLLGLSPGEYLRHPGGRSPASLHEVLWFRQAYLHKSAAGGWFFDDIFLCTLSPAARVFEYDPARRQLADISQRLPQLRKDFCSAIRQKAALAVELQLADGELRWRLGPYRTGAYSLVVAGGEDAYPVPAAGGFQVPAMRAITLRVHYSSPAGWHTYSPPLSVAAERGTQVRYARP